MGSFSVWHWLIVLLVVLVLFGGGGKIPRLMKDMGKGINAFKKGLKEEKGDDESDDGDGERKSIAKGESEETEAAKDKPKQMADG